MGLACTELQNLPSDSAGREGLRAAERPGGRFGWEVTQQKVRSQQALQDLRRYRAFLP